MRDMQAEMWCRLTTDLEDYGYFGDNLYDQSQTPRMIEIEKAYADICDKFKATLAPDQQRVFNQLMELSTDIHWNSHEAGMATGFVIAKELQKFLDNPIDSFQQASATFTPAESACKSCKEGLENYLEKRKAVKRS